MNYIKYLLVISMLFMVGCGTKKVAKNQIKKTKQNQLDSEGKLITDSNPFYPLQESMMDIQNQMLDLKSKVIEYEARLHTPQINMDLLKLVQAPDLKHEIIMQNGTVIQGTIIFENTDQMIIKTRIGQLTIEKEFIAEIKETTPLEPVIEFDNTYPIEERINDDLSITYVGKLENTGLRRGDFVRVIYHFWNNNNIEPIFSDSCFVTGQNTVYLNGVVSDASLEPAETATFNLNIKLPESIEYEYITKEIHWDMFD
jgi:hypothetical protein